MYFYIQLEEPEFSENKTTYMKIKKNSLSKLFLLTCLIIPLSKSDFFT